MFIKLLGKLPLFQGLSEGELEELLTYFDHESFQKGEEVLTEYQGEEEVKMYVILGGAVEIVKRAMNQEEREISLDVLKTGEIFGEMKIVDVLVRSATVRAIKDTQTISISKENLERLLEENPRIYGILMRNIARRLSHRLRKADTFQATMLSKEGRGQAEFSQKSSSSEEKENGLETKS
ncbi:MAG: cyclic nucleotide-binding domain-containing protein [Planctomycetota bacterium]|nr:MAG: cyclic nucleotide-binding domain-containing protein [Planctomycetota bacterium]